MVVYRGEHLHPLLVVLHMAGLVDSELLGQLVVGVVVLGAWSHVRETRSRSWT